jgi:hypothetical protein
MSGDTRTADFQANGINQTARTNHSITQVINLNQMGRHIINQKYQEQENSNLQKRLYQGHVLKRTT